MGSSPGIAAAFPIIKNEPYIATERIQRISAVPGEARVLHEALAIRMRDAEGRIRDHQLASSPDEQGSFTQGVVHILDPITMRDVQWNEDTKDFFATDIPATSSHSQQSPAMECNQQMPAENVESSSSDLERDQLKYEDLGKREIDGLNAVGCRITRISPKRAGIAWSGTTVTEVWSSPELQINLLKTERELDGTEEITKLSDVRRIEPDPALFQVPSGYTDPTKTLPRPAVENTNPNYAAIHEYGRIDWHGSTATLISGGSRPLDMAAYTLSTCLGIAVSSEDPEYLYLGDLLDVTAPQWAATHQDQHAYAARPGKVQVAFEMGSNGLPTDVPKLLSEAASQVNQQEPYAFKVHRRVLSDKAFYSFVPTKTRDEKGVLQEVPAYLDASVNIPPQTNTVGAFADMVSHSISDTSGFHFDCCQALIMGQPWGHNAVSYEALGVSARKVLEDLLERSGGNQSYSLRCQPNDKRWCFINVHPIVSRKAPPGGTCSAQGFEGH